MVTRALGMTYSQKDTYNLQNSTFCYLLYAVYLLKKSASDRIIYVTIALTSDPQSETPRIRTYCILGVPVSVCLELVSQAGPTSVCLRTGWEMKLATQQVVDNI